MEKLFNKLTEMRAIFTIKYDGENYLVKASIKPTTDGKCFVGSLSDYFQKLVTAEALHSDLESAMKIVIDTLSKAVV